MLDRKTTISTSVLEKLQHSKNPLSVAQIIDYLKKNGLNPNKTTIYRILDKLIKKEAVTEMTLRNGVTYYEFVDRCHHHHHHHFICNDCEMVFCLDACHVESYKIKLSELLPNKHFKIQSHDFNLYGTCEPCSQ